MDALARAASDSYRDRERLVAGFFDSESERLAVLCHAMARRFIRGGRLVAFGLGAAATDAQHVSVEFVHPVIVGKRALPALALCNDVASSLALVASQGDSFIAKQIEVMSTREDIALGMVHAGRDPGLPAVATGIKQARSDGMLTIGLAGPGGGLDDAEFPFEVASDDPFIVQEIHETLYHVLWELVHVFFDHKGLLEGRPEGTAHDTGRSSFLYPFLAEAESDLTGVLEDVARSVVGKADDVGQMRAGSLDAEGYAGTARQMADRIRSGGKVLTFGNGGSATDAQDLAADLVAPPHGMKPVPAISLTNDAAVITAIGNDVGFENVFARQVIAYGRPQDVAIAISTSGGSRNLLVAVEEAKRRGLLTICLAGYGGGRLAELCDRSHVINADYIPRIQEAQASQYHVLRSLLALASHNDS
jgi:D-sedoheptulose 7-phosphate isomerase